MDTSSNKLWKPKAYLINHARMMSHHNGRTRLNLIRATTNKAIDIDNQTLQRDINICVLILMSQSESSFMCIPKELIYHILRSLR